MLKKKIQGTRLSTLFILLTWLVCLAFAGAGAILVAGVLDTVGSSTIGEGLFINLELIVIDFLIFLAAIIAAVILSRKLGISISGNKSATNRQVSTIAFGILGLLLGLFAWGAVGKSPAPSILLPISVVIAVQLLVYILASGFALLSHDEARKKAWTPLIYLIMATVPSLILYTIAQ